MKKTMGGLGLLALVAGCVNSQPGSFMSGVGPMGQSTAPADGCRNGACVASAAPGLMGPWGESVPMHGGPGGPGDPGTPSAAEAAARATFAQGLPADLVQQVVLQEDARRGSGLLQAGLPPGGPPPGLSALPGPVPPLGSGLPGAVAAVGALAGPPAPFLLQRTSVRFTAPNGMKISWYAPSAGGRAEFTPTAIQVPGRYNFPQAAIYRLKLSDILGRPGLELYPTLEVVPANSKTSTFLAHSSVPLTFTPDDFEQVANGNYLVKVIYLPYPQFQDVAVAGPGEIVSTRLEAGADPIAEALQRGSILLVVRLGNIDLEAPGTPPMDAPSPYQKLPPPGFGMAPPGMAPPGMMPPGMGGPGMFPGAPGLGPMLPYGMANGGGPQMPGMPGMPQMPGMMPPAMPVPPGTPTSMPPPQPPGLPLTPSGAAAPSSDTVAVQFKAAQEADKKEPAKKAGWFPWPFAGKADK